MVMLACLSMILALLAWIGWRFFVLPRSVSIPTVAESSATNGKSAAPWTNCASQAPCGRKRRALRSRWPWLAWFSHWAVWLMPALAGLTVAGVFMLAGGVSPDPLHVSDFQHQKHIRSALNPEKLVPPPALPPSVFLNTERPGLEKADRDWSRLHPDFMRLALLVFARVEARGYRLALLEGFRSPERQDMLAGLAVPVTNAHAFESKHQYGLALDAAPLRDGRLVISERDPWAIQAYQVLGEEAEKLGLVWGGRWKLRDYGHIEASGPVSAGLKRK